MSSTPPPKYLKSLSRHSWLKYLYLFLQIIICKNWSISYKSLLLVLHLKQHNERVQEPWASPKFQPALNPKPLIPSQRQWGLRSPKTQMTSGPRRIQILPPILLSWLPSSPNHTHQHVRFKIKIRKFPWDERTIHIL